MQLREKAVILILTVCALALLTGRAAAASENAEAGLSGSTTVMIYMVGSDLEAGGARATQDLNEMIGSGVDLNRTHVLVCAGGTGKWWPEDPLNPGESPWQTDPPDPGKITMLRLTETGFAQERILEPQSMGEAVCLAGFINTAVAGYPADHYILIFWDHGNGPVIGFGKDLLFGEDSLELPEMRQAMEQTAFADVLRLDWVGFDACLMASAELACIWKDYADYLVCSQETEPGFGWNYSFLTDCGSSEAGMLARAAADAYIDYGRKEIASRENYHPEMTMSVLDLSRTEALENAVNALFHVASSDISGDYIRLAKARADIRAVGRSSSGGFDYDLVDLRTVAERMANDYPKECGALQTALEEAVIYAVEEGVTDCSGISLFYPFYNKAYYRRYWKDAYREIAVFPEYLNYLERYESIWLGTDMQRYFSDEMELEMGASPSSYVLQLTPEQADVYAASNYYVLRRVGDGLYSLVYLSNDVGMEDGKLTATFDGRIIYCQSDYSQRIVPGLIFMWGTQDGITDYSAESITLRRERDSGGREIASAEIQFSANPETEEIVVNGIYRAEEGESGGKRETLELSEWTTIRFFIAEPRFITRDDQGKMKYYWDWEGNGWTLWNDIPVADHPRFLYAPLYDDGDEYYIVINVRDVQGNTYTSELFPLRLPPAPEEEKRPADTVRWVTGDSVTLLEKDGVTLQLSTTIGLGTGSQIYYVTLDNRNDYPVTVSMSGNGAVINGGIGSYWFEQVNMDPGGNSVLTMWNLTRDALLSPEGQLRSLFCRCRVSRTDTKKTLYDGQISVEIPISPVPSFRLRNAMNAAANEQQLLETDGVCVDLLDLGIPTDSYQDTYSAREGMLTVSLHIRNDSGTDKDISLNGLSLNGIYMACGSGGDSTRAGIRLKDGESWYPRIEKRMNEIRRLDYDGMNGIASERADLPQITSINTCSVFLMIDGELYECPVTLSEKGTQDFPVPDGEIIYRDHRVEVWLHGFSFVHSDLTGEEIPTWYFWVVNCGSDILHASYETSKEDARFSYWLANDVVLPGEMVFRVAEDLSGDGEPLSFVIEQYYWYSGGDEYRSDPIALPVQRGETNE